MIIKRGRLTESGVELGGLGFIGDIQGFWKRAPFILVTGIAHIWWLAQLTAVPGNKIGTDMCRIFLIAVTTTPFTPIAADAFPKTVTIVLTGLWQLEQLRKVCRLSRCRRFLGMSRLIQLSDMLWLIKTM